MASPSAPKLTNSTFQVLTLPLLYPLLLATTVSWSPFISGIPWELFLRSSETHPHSYCLVLAIFLLSRFGLFWWGLWPKKKNCDGASLLPWLTSKELITEWPVSPGSPSHGCFCLPLTLPTCSELTVCYLYGKTTQVGRNPLPALCQTPFLKPKAVPPHPYPNDLHTLVKTVLLVLL